MANLPSQHPNLSLHLTDRALNPLITSARDPTHLARLTSLTQTAQAAHESAARLGLGAAQRIMVEHGDGPVLLQTFLSPIQQPPSQPSASPSATPPTNGGRHSHSHSHSHSPHQGALALAVENRNNTSTPQPQAQALADPPNLRGGAANDRALFLAADDDPDDDDDDGDDEEENPDAPPMLFGIVVAPRGDDTREARRAAVRLERVGREFQSRWAELQQQQSQSQSQSQSPAPRGRSDERQGPDAAAD
ncbi:hypothetical protein F4859DRAFT_454011 [Xylaria cf. heliscus]|nr:hypothetical protein F4859DRAFT_454011 [Xylaria cf. heliscus]